MTLSTRKPTGVPATPLVLVTGYPKAGKSLTAYRISRSPRIDRTFVFDLGEGSADEYAEAGPYEVVDWGGSWRSLADTIRAAVAVRPVDGKLNAIVIDSVSEVWEGLKDRAAKRARSSKRARDMLARDPDAEIDVSMTYWNDAATAHGSVVAPLRLARHVVGVLIARTEDVTKVVNGAPTPERIDSIQGHKSLPSITTAHVIVRPDHTAWLVSARTMRVQIPTKNGLRLDDDNPLGHVLDLLAPDDGKFGDLVAQMPVDNERHGEDDEAVSAEQAAAFVAALDGLRPVESRTRAKQLFVQEFGMPTIVPLRRHDEAAAWVARQVEAHRTEPGTDEPDEPGTDEPGPGPVTEDAAPITEPDPPVEAQGELVAT